MVRQLHLAIVLLGCAFACRDAPAPKSRTAEVPAVARVLDPTAPLRVESLGTPVHGARAWTTALSPNPRGGWNLITHAYSFRSDLPSEFIVLDLATGKTRVTVGPKHVYSAKRFQIANQLRAANGRIFLPQSDGSVAYYDPVDENVKRVRWKGDPPRSMVYSAAFGRNGKLYGGTQGKGLPAIVEIDPDTSTGRVIGRVGAVRYGYSYAYDIAVDWPWIYVTVGQSPWELVALNGDTGESKVLAMRDRDAWMSLDARREAVVATLTSNRRTNTSREVMWCVDGRLVASGDKLKSRLRARDTQPLSFRAADAPDVELAGINPDSHGIGRVRWRESGKAQWNVTEYRAQYTEPVAIESLAALPDGTLLGSSAQYQGFFRYTPQTRSFERYPPHGPSRAVLSVIDNNVYITGYPNGALYRYDPTRKWTAARNAPKPNANPLRLGHFEQAGTKYAYFLKPDSDGRLYYLGRRERDGFGSGVGRFDPATSTFSGHSNGLNFLYPRGLAVLEEPRRIVVSGKLHPDPRYPDQLPRHAELVIYDAELRELERHVVKPNLQETGNIYPSPTKGVVVGIVQSPPALYRYDITSKTLLAWNELEAPVGASTQRADGSIWAIVDSTLVRIDPVSLELTTFGKRQSIPVGAAHLTWLGDDLYLGVGAELVRLQGVGLKKETHASP